MIYSSHKIIKDLSLKVYFNKKLTLFRHYQNMFLEQYGPLLKGKVVELGCEKSYDHARFITNAEVVICSNIGRDYDYYLDVTKMDFPDSSQDSFLCISVLEHVFNIQQAFSEINRTLKPGGQLLLTIPFAYPYHDEYDCWRLSIDSYYKFLEGFEVKEFVHLGGTFSTIADNLARPKAKYTLRYIIYKFLGATMVLFGKFLERKDGFPLGYAIYAVKKPLS